VKKGSTGMAENQPRKDLANGLEYKQFRFFGVAVVLLEPRCRSILRAAGSLAPETADAQVRR
jgi:hypothetical protein